MLVGAPASHAPSVKSLGITSQLTGSRADLIVLDDIEVVNNSATQGMRDKLSEAVKETDAIIKPLDTSKIVFLVLLKQKRVSIRNYKNGATRRL